MLRRTTRYAYFWRDAIAESASILISEIFGPTIQGEGALIGRLTVFVRTGGCDFRCSWCDTLYAVLPAFKADWQPWAAEQILERVEQLSGGHPVLITLSGGNPALQPLEELLRLGHARGHSFALETQGSIARDWFGQLDHLVLSPKPPSSGMAFKPEALGACLDAVRGHDTVVSLKIVVFDEADFQFARQVAGSFGGFTLYLSVGNPTPGTDMAPSEADLTARLEWLLARCAQIGWVEPVILPQLHGLLWGNKRGV